MDVRLIVAFGFLGGAAADFLAMLAVLKTGRSLARTRVGVLRKTMALVGGGIVSAIVVSAYLLSGMSLSPILAIQVGASTPLLLQQFASTLPALHSSRPSANTPGAGPAAKEGDRAIEAIRSHFAIAE